MKRFAVIFMIFMAQALAASGQDFNYSTTALYNVGQSVRNYVYNRPTVSPYVNLTRTDISSIMPNYQNLVRPQVERRRQTAEQAARIQPPARQLNRMQSNLSSFTQQRRDMQPATGHPTQYMAYLHYFPAPPPRR